MSNGRAGKAARVLCSELYEFSTSGDANLIHPAEIAAGRLVDRASDLPRARVVESATTIVSKSRHAIASCRRLAAFALGPPAAEPPTRTSTNFGGSHECARQARSARCANPVRHHVAGVRAQRLPAVPPDAAAAAARGRLLRR